MRRLAQCGTAIGLAATLCTLGQSCTPSAPSAEEKFRNAPVYITAFEDLAPPAIGFERVYQPTSIFEIDPAASAGQAVGLRLTVATRAPSFLHVRLMNLSAGTTQALQRIDPPTPDERAAASDAPRPFNTAARDLLASGQSIFWLDDQPATGDGLEHHFALLIPESSGGAFAGLDLFTATASDGSPIGIDHIELVRSFFYMAVIGDSVAWGNGLLDQDKYPALVAGVIEHDTQRKVIRQTLALSAAHIVPDPTDGICGISCYREAPAVSTSVTAQVDLVQRPELIGLVLMDGCINDVHVSKIIDPQTTQDQLVAASAQFCRDDMTTLIEKARAKMPQAPIVVTGYYPIISLTSDLSGLQTFSQSQNVTPSEDLTTFIQGAAANSLTFADSSRTDLAAAVAAAGAAEPADPPIVFVDPGFSTDNAVFTPNTWLWGLTTDSSAAGRLSTQLTLFPEDPQFPSRITACLNSSGAGLTPDCIFASLGHPNKRGAQAYADAIVVALRQTGFLPSTPTP